MPKNNISMFNFKLVEAVEQHPCLYDYNLRDYSNRELTNSVWESIAARLKADVQECKNTWKNLRIVFTRYLRNQESDTSKKRKEYYLNTRMMFLCPFVRPKSSSTLSASHIKNESKLTLQQLQHQQEQYQMKQESSSSIDMVKLEMGSDSYNTIYNGCGIGGDDGEGDGGGGGGGRDDEDDYDDIYTEWPPIECKIDCSDTDEMIPTVDENDQHVYKTEHSDHAYNVDEDNKFMMTITLNNNNNNNDSRSNGHETMDDVKYVVDDDDDDDDMDGDDDDEVRDVVNTHLRHLHDNNNQDAEDEYDDPPELIESQNFVCHMSEESSSDMPTMFNSQNDNQTNSDEYNNHHNHNQRLPQLQYNQEHHPQQRPQHDHNHSNQPSLTNSVNSHNRHHCHQQQQQPQQQRQHPRQQRHSARLSNHLNSTATMATTAAATATTATTSATNSSTTTSVVGLKRRRRHDQPQPQQRAQSSLSSSSERVSDELTSDFITNYSNLLLHSNQNNNYRKWYLLSLIRDLDEMSDTQFREFRRRTDAVIDDIMRPSTKKAKQS